MAKKRRALAWTPLRDLMKKAGAEIASKDAVSLLIDTLESRAKDVTGKAVDIAKHSKRKKVMDIDIKMAIELLK